MKHICAAANAYKKKGIPVTEIFQYLFLLIFSNRSMYLNLITGRNTPAFAKDTVYRFMKMIQINWIRFTTILSSRIIKDAVIPLDSEDRANVLIIDDGLLFSLFLFILIFSYTIQVPDFYHLLHKCK